MLDQVAPKIHENITTISLGKKKIEVHSMSLAYDPDYESKKHTILILPGLDDSVFFYEKAFQMISQYNSEWDVVGVDLRGQGRTRDKEGRINQAKISIQEQCEILNSFLKQNEIEKVFIVALSYGAAVAMEFSFLHPKLVSGLGLIAPYVTNFKAYKRGFTGLFYGLLSLNPFQKKIAKFGLPNYFVMSKLKGRLNPNINWTPQRLSYLTKLTMGILEVDTDKLLQHFPYLPKGIHIMTACNDDVVPISAHRHFYNHIPKSIEKSFSLEDTIGHRVLQDHPKQAAKWLTRILK